MSGGDQVISKLQLGVDSKKYAAAGLGEPSKIVICFSLGALSAQPLRTSSSCFLQVIENQGIDVLGSIFSEDAIDVAIIRDDMAFIEALAVFLS